MTRARRSQRGFTLIELMIALVVSSLLVGMILAIFNRMSISYRGQQQIAGVQQVLSAARATIETDAKQAGFMMPQGFKLGGAGAPVPLYAPVMWSDSSTGPDSLAFFYADPTLQAKATAARVGRTFQIDLNPGFGVGSLIVMVNSDTTLGTGSGNEPTVAQFDACVGKISSITSGALATVTLSTAGPWGLSSSSNCTVNIGTMVYAFVAHAYRIDTTTDPTITSGPMFPSARGTLQMSATGGLLAITGSGTEQWNDLAFGFTDIQVAMRFYDNDLTDKDGDGDAARDWYSSSDGAALTDPNTGALSPWGPFTAPLRMSISLVARTDRDIEGISTSQTPKLIGVGPPVPPVAYNPIGNHASVALPAQAPWSTDPLLKGARVYRYVTFQVDLRNIGVGR